MKGKSKSKGATPELIRFDWAMKRLLRQKSNFSVLEGFLSVLLNEEVKIINIKESESNQEHSEDKFNRVDILVENHHGELLIIEVQNNEQVDYFLRMLYGVSKTITEHISKGDSYSKVRKVYHINIVYFELGQGRDYVYVGTTEFRGLHFNDVLRLTKEQKDYFAVENRKSASEVKDLYPVYFLLCVKNFDFVAKNSLDEWMYYLKNNDVPNDFTAPGLKEVRKRLQYDRLPEREKLAYDHHLEQKRYERSTIDTALFKGEYRGRTKGLAEGRAKGLVEGHAKGRAEALAESIAERDRLNFELTTAQTKIAAAQAEKEVAQKNVVINMSQSGCANDFISSITGLSQEEVIKILENASEK